MVRLLHALHDVRLDDRDAAGHDVLTQVQVGVQEDEEEGFHEVHQDVQQVPVVRREALGPRKREVGGVLRAAVGHPSRRSPPVMST